MDKVVRFGGSSVYDYIVLGAGPGGLQMGQHLASAGHEYLILEAGEAPGTFPPTEDLLRHLCDEADFHELNIRCNVRILQIEKPDPNQFGLTDTEGNVFCGRRLIVAMGVGERFDNSVFAEGCRPVMVINNRFPAKTCEWESINVPNLYFASTLMQANDFKKHTYNVRSLFRMLEKKHHHRDWPCEEIEATPEGLVEATVARINRTSALWQQFGFLHDVIVVDEGWDRAVYYEEMPLAYLQGSEIGESQHYYTIALEVGKVEDDRSNILRFPGPGKAEESVFLHPVIRRWCGHHLVSEKHLLEDLFGQEDAHVGPLRCFYMEQILESVDADAATHYEDREVREIPAPRPVLRSVASF